MRTSTFFKIFLIISFTIKAQSGQTVIAHNGMVASASEIASKVGVQIMIEGGNAIDAAVATGFALAVTYPSAGNLGGGGFMVIHMADGKETTIDYREKAPGKASRDMYIDQNGKYNPKLSREGMKSVGVPGTVAGLYYAWQKYGSLSWDKILQPSIDLAEKGFRLNYFLKESINNYQEQFEKYPSSVKIFRDSKNPFSEGELFVQKDLAETLIKIKEFGSDGFYKGETADLIIKTVNKYGGIISKDDLANYRPIERKPIIGSYKGYKIISMPPPSSGGIALVQILNSLEEISFDKNEWGSSKYIHTLVEVFKRVYADRSMHLGDPDFYNVPVEYLTSKAYAAEIAHSITSKATPSEEIAPVKIYQAESEETTHFSVVDKYGNAVSVTTTLNSSYGNKIVVEGAGFLLNNEMDDFSAKPGEPNQFGLIGSTANSIQPGKRMLSSMTPTIILKNGKPFLIVGSPGGATIITSVAQVILNVIEFNMNLFEAVNNHRIHHQWLPDRIDYEEFGLSLDIKNALVSMGHNIGKERILGIVQAIEINDGIIWGISDKRNYGRAVGY